MSACKQANIRIFKQANDHEEFRMSLRMTKEAYNELLELVRPFITEETTNWREPIPAEERLALTMRYLAFGKPYQIINLN